MRQSKQVILTAALTLALVALSWLAGQSRGRVQTLPVVIVRQDIKAGDLLEEQMLHVIEMPVTAVQPEWLNQKPAAVGLRAKNDLSAGEILHLHRLADPAQGVLYPAPGPGRRLMTIRLDAASANGFWLAEGNRVDIHLLPRSGQVMETQVLENIRILKILDGTKTGSGFTASAADPLLCLDLSREQAALLAAAETWGVLKLSVVNEASAESSP